MAQTFHMFRIDVGYQPGHGYGAILTDVALKRQKGIKGNSIRQLMRRVSEQVAEEEQHKRRFPLESEPRIIVP